MSLKNKTVVVTGGAGFIGSHLIDRIIKEEPEKIFVLSNFYIGSKNNLEEAQKNFNNLEIVELDITDYKQLKKFFKDNLIEVVFNLAVIPINTSIIKPKWTFKKNISMSVNLCELARKDLFETLIQFSSSEVYGTAKYVPMDEKHPLNPKTPYAASKAATDHLVQSYYRTFKIDTALVRPFNNYGPRQSTEKFAGVVPLTIKRMLNNEDVIIFGDGEQTRDYIFVEDTAEGAVKIYNTKQARGLAINIATGKETSINKLVSEIAKNLNYKKKIIYQKARLGDVRRHLADITLAKTVLDFESKTSIEEGIKRTVDWYKKHLNSDVST